MMYFYQVESLPYTTNNSSILRDDTDHSVIHYFSYVKTRNLKRMRRFCKDACIVSMDDFLPESSVIEWTGKNLAEIKPPKECFLGVCTHVDHDLSHGTIRRFDTGETYHFKDKDCFSNKDFKMLHRGQFVIFSEINKSNVDIILRIIKGLSLYCNPDQKRRREQLVKLLQLANVEFDQSIFDTPLRAVLKPIVEGKGNKNCRLSYSLTVK